MTKSLILWIKDWENWKRRETWLLFFFFSFFSSLFVCAGGGEGEMVILGPVFNMISGSSTEINDNTWQIYSS